MVLSKSLLCSAGLVAALALSSGCSSDEDCCFVEIPSTTLVFGTEGNRLHAYDLSTGRSQVVLPSHADSSAHGRDINGQICFAPDQFGRFIAGEDTGQPEKTPGWGVFQLEGLKIGKLSAYQTGKLIPTYRTANDNREPYGCAFLPDGRVLTTDIGDQQSGPPTGQLILWFPSLTDNQARYCKLDVEIGTAGGIWVDRDNRIYVASNRVEPGIYRYSGPLPTSDTPAGGCDSVDDTGAPLTTQLTRERFIVGGSSLPTPSGIVQSPQGTFYVSSVVSGSINEYDADGNFLRIILRPDAGEQPPYSTGTPFGLAIDAQGTLYYADLGVVVQPPDIGPADGRGSFRRIQFEGGQPLPPSTIDQGLDFPDGITVVVR